MAIKGEVRPPEVKVAIAVALFLGSLAVAGVANMFLTALMRGMGQEGSTVHVIITWTLYVLAAIFATFVIWVGWLDIEPTEMARIKAERQAAATDHKKSKTPMFDQVRENDRKAFLAVMAEGNGDNPDGDTEADRND